MKKGKRIFALLLSAVMISTLTITGCEKKAPAVKSFYLKKFKKFKSVRESRFSY